MKEITPETKIGDLIDAWPQCEEVLIELSPAFAKLRNPVLKRTVAKVATIRQAAAVGRVSLGKMVNTLRRAAGQNTVSVPEGEETVSRPDWAIDERIKSTLDARPILERGEHPMKDGMAGIDGLKNGDVYLLITPFVPAPLIDLAARRGFESWSSTESDELVRTYFRRKPA